MGGVSNVVLRGNAALNVDSCYVRFGWFLISNVTAHYYQEVMKK